MNCYHCDKELNNEDIHDTTYSNVNTGRASVGQHTGDIYKCPECEQYTLDNFLSCKLEPWSY